jgi:DNA-binding NtrC family response regulator
MKDYERERILEALTSCGGNQTAAAKLLGVSRRMLVNRLNLYDIPRPRKGRIRQSK